MVNNIAIILLAAGQSRRFGSNKLLAEVNGEPLIRLAVKKLANLIDTDLYVVVNPQQPEYQNLPSLINATSSNIVPCSDASKGMSQSLSCGIKTVLASETHYQGILIALADQVAITTGEHQRLINIFNEGQQIVAASYDDTIGVPAIFDVSYAKELMDLKGDQGARQLLKKHIDSVTTTIINNAALDIDTPSDLAVYLQQTAAT